MQLVPTKPATDGGRTSSYTKPVCFVCSRSRAVFRRVVRQTAKQGEQLCFHAICHKPTNATRDTNYIVLLGFCTAVETNNLHSRTSVTGPKIGFQLVFNFARCEDTE